MADIVPPESKTVVDPPADELVAPQADETPLLEPNEDPPAPAPRLHPLAPGGKRFEQIYARGKTAEREAQELRERLAVAEAKLEVLTTKPADSDQKPEYSWAELETFIQQGRITRADAEAHREEVQTRRLTKKVKDEFVSESQQKTRDQVLTQTLQDYVAAVPAILEEGSVDRVRLDEEFDFLASVQGLDPAKVDGVQRKALQASALRAVYGPIDSLKKRSAPAKMDTTQGLPGGARPTVSVSKEQAILNTLTKTQVAHYRKMMDAGRYKGGWKDVVAELSYDPKNRTSKKG